jgi:hypothetical protein
VNGGVVVALQLCERLAVDPAEQDLESALDLLCKASSLKFVPEFAADFQPMFGLLTATLDEITELGQLLLAGKCGHKVPEDRLVQFEYPKGVFPHLSDHSQLSLGSIGLTEADDQGLLLAGEGAHGIHF